MIDAQEGDLGPVYTTEGDLGPVLHHYTVLSN